MRVSFIDSIKVIECWNLAILWKQCEKYLKLKKFFQLKKLLYKFIFKFITKNLS